MTDADPQTPFLEGRITEVHPSHYIVKTDEGPYRCTLRGKLQEENADLVRPAAAGDYVDITVSSKKEGAIERIHDRSNKISRPAPRSPNKEQIIAANVDLMIGLQAFKEPEFTPTLLDHSLAAAEQFDLPEQLICFNKMDLVDDPVRARDHLPDYEDIGYPVLHTSAIEPRNLDRLRQLMQKKTTVLVGPSGSGKTSLLNALNPELDLDVGELGSRTKKGTHRTSSMTLHPIGPETYGIDTPGVNFLSLWECDFEQVQYHYPDIYQIRRNCSFDDCVHLKEPGCAVKQAVEQNELHPLRYESYSSAVEKLKNEQLHE